MSLTAFFFGVLFIYSGWTMLRYPAQWDARIDQYLGLSRSLLVGERRAPAVARWIRISCGSLTVLMGAVQVVAVTWSALVTQF